MQTKLTKLQPDFEPFELNIKVESKEEAEILFRLVNLSGERGNEIVNGPYAPHAHVKHSSIKQVTDSIYYALQSRFEGEDPEEINIYTPVVGDKYLCIKDVFMEVNNYHVFTLNEIYKCEVPNCLTDNFGNNKHYVVVDGGTTWLFKHFSIFVKNSLKVSAII